jgi:hypothetical protein
VICGSSSCSIVASHAQATLPCEFSPSFHRQPLISASQCALAFIARRAPSFSSSRHRDADGICPKTHVTAPKTVVFTAADSMLAVNLSKTTTPSRSSGLGNGKGPEATIHPYQQFAPMTRHGQNTYTNRQTRHMKNNAVGALAVLRSGHQVRWHVV